MLGIVSVGVHIPTYRMKRDDIANAWGVRSLGGERTVAGHDEDSLTMAVNAALDCVSRRSEQVNGLFFTSTTSPYREKQAAATVATVLGLSSESCTADITGSRRSATTAINLAMSMVESRLAWTHQNLPQNVLVTASDCRLAAPQTELEQRIGDAAAAVIIGNSNPIARIVGSHSVFDEFFDSWRLEGDIFVRSWEERFTTTEGYMRVVKQAISQLLKEHALSANDFSKVVLCGPDPRSQARLARSLGFDTNTQLQDLLFTTIGDSGTAAPLLMLTAALEKAKVGDKILLASYGDGSDLFILEVTENIGQIQDEQRMQKLLARKIYINYEKYLSWRNLVTVEFPRRPEPQVPSVTCRWRERRRILALYGVKCRQCGTIQYPAQRVCLTCGAKDNFEDYKFSDKKARIFTYATDRLTPSKAAPTVNTVIEFEGGGRMICELTDCDPTKVELGMPVEMTFRKLHEFTGMYDYFWKARPEYNSRSLQEEANGY